jgi:hypothetical protein
MTSAVRRSIPAVLRADLDGAMTEQGQKSLSKWRSLSKP